jgi:hypothetical protein
VYNGERIRFFGGSLGRGANFPEHNESEAAARRLAKLGCNIVRLHQMDASYAPDGIWQDIGDGSRRTLDAGQLEKLDYLIYQLKQHGIFVDLNLHVSRTLTGADGIKDDPLMPDNNKGVDIFDAKMRELHKEYATQIFTHQNAYTELPYYNDPVIAMVEVTNEDSLLGVWRNWIQRDIDGLGEYYQKELDELWGVWWEENIGGSPPRRPTKSEITAGECTEDLATRYIDFLLYLEEDYHEDMRLYLEKIGGEEGVGVRVPISGTNYGTIFGVKSSSFHDRHSSYGSWGDSFFLDSITKYPFLRFNSKDHRPIPRLAGGKVTGKPYIASELACPFPNHFAAEPIMLGAIYAAYHDWDGILPFAYKHYHNWQIGYVARPNDGSMHDFDRHMTKLAAVTVASLLFRRHDLTTGSDPLKVVATRQDILEHPYENPDFNFNLVTNAFGHLTDPMSPDDGYLPAYASLMRRIEVDIGDIHSVSTAPDAPEDHIFRADIGEVTHEIEWHYDPENIDDSFFKADTENVQVLAGAIDSVQSHSFTRGILNGGSIGNVTLTASALIAVILVESIETSRTYLIIATGKMENDGFDPSLGPDPEPGEPQTYYFEDTQDWGNAPVWVEGIGADITLPFPVGIVEQFYSLNPDGSDHTELEPEPHGQQCILHLIAANETLWYRLRITL